MDEAAERRTLERGARTMGLELDRSKQDLLLRFLELMRKWNRTVNLTAIRNAREMVTHHLLDSLSVLHCVRGDRLLDLGSGGGLPGIPLAIADDSLRVTLLDSRGRRTAFLEQVRIELGLANIEVITARAQEYSGATFDTVVVRAFGTLGHICEAATHLIDVKGTLVAMKGKVSEEELASVGSGFAVRDVIDVEVPGIAETRTLVVLARADA